MTASTTPTNAQNQELLSAYARSHSVSLRNKIVQLNMGLVRDAAYDMSLQCPVPYEDLEQIGAIGLIRAIERFDPKEGCTLSSFAVPFIRGRMLQYLRGGWGVVNPPRRSVETASKVYALVRQMAVMGRKVEPWQAAAALKIDRDKWRSIESEIQRKPIAQIDDLEIGDDEVIDPEQIERKALQKRLMSAIARLPTLRRSCLTESYFLGRSEAAIARRHKIQVAEVNQIISESLSQLQSQLVTQGKQA